MNRSILLLTFVNFICYLDRYIIASVSPKVEVEFGLSHVQTGMFMSAFMIGYMLTSPLFGYLGDRGRRPMLMAVGVLIWSLATFSSGLAAAFLALVVARMIVGVGEASFATLAPPFIRDSMVDESKVNRALGFFYLALPIGAAVGYMWGGWMAEHSHWRWAFYLGAIPGLVLTIAVARMSEPAYRQRQFSTSSIWASLRSILSNRVYVLAVGGYVAQTFALGGFSAWAPQYGVDVLGVSLTESAFKVGASTLLSGLIGTAIGGQWGHVFLKAGADKTGTEAAMAFCKFCGWTSVIATPLAFWTFRAQHFNEFILAAFLVQVAIFAALAPVNTAILAAVPTKLAATAFAFSIFALHALGDVISPPLVGLLADHMPMQNAMMLLVGAIAISSVIWFIGGIKSSTKGSTRGNQTIVTAIAIAIAMMWLWSVGQVSLACSAIAESVESPSSWWSPSSNQGEFTVGANYDWQARGGIVFLSPRGQVKSTFRTQRFNSNVQDVGSDFHWTSKFGSITISQFGRDFPMQGMNEHGLAGMVFVAPASYPHHGSAGTINESQWLQVQLDLYGTVAEVVDHVRDLAIQKISADLHWFLCDRSGACAVIEFLAGQPVVHTGADLIFPVLTNSTYDQALSAYHEWKSGDHKSPEGYASLNRFIRLASRFLEGNWSKQTGSMTQFDKMQKIKSVLEDVSLKGFTAWQSVFALASRTVDVRLDQGRWYRLDLESLDFECQSILPMMVLKLDSTNSIWKSYSHREVDLLFATAAVGTTGLGPAQRSAVLSASEAVKCDH